MSDQRESFEGWAILELFGHRKLGGRLSQVEIAGQGFIRIDVPDVEADQATQFYAPSAVYGITPCTEATARAIAAYQRPQPVTVWEVARGEAITAKGQPDDDDPIDRFLDGGDADDPAF
jgi:hypothetical protein